MAAIEHLPLVRVNQAQPFFRGFVASVKDIWSYRELLVNLVRKELKVKYKDSVLGFLWTLLRPAFLLIIYYIVIGKFLGSGIPFFPIYLFSGLVAWDMFASVLGGCTGSIVGGAALIKKVYFPREILPLAVVGAALVHFALQLAVLAAFMGFFRYNAFGPNLLVLPIAVLTLVIFMTAIGLVLAAANVYLRDVQYLLEVILLFWFWMTPIVYPIHTATSTLQRHSSTLLFIYLLNPLANIVIAFQRAIYKNVYVKGNQVLFNGAYIQRLLCVLLLSFFMLWLAQRIFTRAQGNFAQEL